MLCWSVMPVRTSPFVFYCKYCIWLLCEFTSAVCWISCSLYSCCEVSRFVCALDISFSSLYIVLACWAVSSFAWSYIFWRSALCRCVSDSLSLSCKISISRRVAWDCNYCNALCRREEPVSPAVFWYSSHRLASFLFSLNTRNIYRYLRLPWTSLGAATTWRWWDMLFRVESGSTVLDTVTLSEMSKNVRIYK